MNDDNGQAAIEETEQLAALEAKLAVYEARFAAYELFVTEVTAVPWGALSKSEIEFQLFKLLVSCETVDRNRSDLRIADQLRTTPARIRNLRFRLDQRSGPEELLTLFTPKNVQIQLVKRDDQEFLLVHVNGAYLREIIGDAIRDNGSIAINTLSPGTFEIGRRDFLDMLNTLVSYQYDRLTDEQKGEFEEFQNLLKDYDEVDWPEKFDKWARRSSAFVGLAASVKRVAGAVVGSG